MTTLRPYQQVAIDAIRASYASGHRSPLLVSPTGSGKTVLFAYVTANAARKGNRVMILAHRAELIDQISDALKAESVEHGFCTADGPKRLTQVTVASVQTLARRSLPCPDLLICDEAHHATATNTYGKIFARYPKARRLGVTATPCRLSGESLGDVYDDLVFGPSVSDLTTAGYLSPARIFAPPTVDTAGLHLRAGEFVQSEVAERMSKPSVTGDAIEHYRKLADGKSAVCFCYSIEHSQAMAQAFRDAGYVAAHLDGNTPRETRKSMITDFRDGRLQVLCSVDVVSEGFDVPSIHCGILLRPTASESLYLQQVGRCLRTFQGKEHAILLDHVGNTLRHGLPSEEREWSLTAAAKSHRKAKSANEITVRVCPSCFAAQATGAITCRVCGHQFIAQSRDIDHRDGELAEITAASIAARHKRQAVGRARTREELQAIAAERGYKPNWVEIQLSIKKKRQQHE